jgi:hypothetical protein
MKDMNLKSDIGPVCSDSLVDDLIRSAKRQGKASVPVPTAYPGPATRGLDDKHHAIQQRWNAIMAELTPKGYLFSWTHTETHVQQCGGKTEYFTIITISWDQSA